MNPVADKLTNQQLWINAFNQMLDTLLMHPAENWIFWTMAAISFLVLTWVFSRVGERLGVANVEGFAGFFAGTIGAAAMLATMTAAHLYLAPKLRIEPGFSFLLIVAFSSSLFVVAPLIKFWTQARFFSTVAAWCMSLFCAVVILLCLGYGFGSFTVGKSTVEKNENRKALNEVMNSK
jgi:hypothetical protein